MERRVSQAPGNTGEVGAIGVSRLICEHNGTCSVSITNRFLPANVFVLGQVIPLWTVRIGYPNFNANPGDFIQFNYTAPHTVCQFTNAAAAYPVCSFVAVTVNALFRHKHS